MNSNLTENQNNIITKLVSDFIELNNVKPLIQLLTTYLKS
jgi:hypothetical protein